MSGVISRVTLIIAVIRGLLTLLVTTHEPPSGPSPISEGCRSMTVAFRRHARGVSIFGAIDSQTNFVES